MTTFKTVGKCPTCDCSANVHVGGTCYGDPENRPYPLGIGCKISFCGWRYLGRGNVWGVTEGWWHWKDLPENKSFTIVPEQVEYEHRANE